MNNLDATFSALADPTRRAILARLSQGEANVLELAQPFALSQPAVSRHIKVLETAGLIERRVEGTKRPCRLVREAFAGADEWIAQLRKGLEANYDRLDRLMAETESQDTP